jgi:hypothetical protein
LSPRDVSQAAIDAAALAVFDAALHLVHVTDSNIVELAGMLPVTAANIPRRRADLSTCCRGPSARLTAQRHSQRALTGFMIGEVTVAFVSGPSA